MMHNLKQLELKGQSMLGAAVWEYLDARKVKTNPKYTCKDFVGRAVGRFTFKGSQLMGQTGVLAVKDKP